MMVKQALFVTDKTFTIVNVSSTSLSEEFYMLF